MAFNSYTYRANKYQREAWAFLAQARDLKERMARGTAYEWERDRMPFFVSQAKVSMRISLSNRELARLTKRKP